MMTIRTSVAAALMCGAMALPASAAGVGASANGTAGIDTTAQSEQTNSAVSTEASSSIGTPSTTAGVNGGINAQSETQSSATGETAMNAHGNMAPTSDTSAGQSSMQGGDKLAANESAFRDVGGNTSTKYRAKSRSADFNKEAQVTAQLNQEAAKMAAPSGG